jgi:antitoxin MazE
MVAECRVMRKLKAVQLSMSTQPSSCVAILLSSRENQMQTKIKKWGNSAVVRLPATMLARLNLKVGSPVELTADDAGVHIVPTAAKPVFRLDDLLAEITTDNRHDCIDWGGRCGS